MMNQIDANYQIDRVTAVLDNAKVVARSCPEGFLSILDIPGKILTDQDCNILFDFMRAEKDDDLGLIIILKGNNKMPIYFEKEEDAISSATQQIPHLGKQLLFSIFRKIGVKFSLGSQTIQPEV